MPSQSQGGGKLPWESLSPSVPGNPSAGDASTPERMPSGHYPGTNWAPQDKKPIVNKKLNKSELTLGGEGAAAQFTQETLAGFFFSSVYGLPMTSGHGKGGLDEELLLRRGPSPRGPAVLRAGTAPARRGDRRNREGEGTKALPGEMEGRTEKGRAAVLFYRFITPEPHGRKTKNQYQRALIHVEGGGISVP